MNSEASKKFYSDVLLLSAMGIEINVSQGISFLRKLEEKYQEKALAISSATIMGKRLIQELQNMEAFIVEIETEPENVAKEMLREKFFILKYILQYQKNL